MMRQSLAPVISAASTNSFSRSESTLRADDPGGVEPAEEREDEDQA